MATILSTIFGAKQLLSGKNAFIHLKPFHGTKIIQTNDRFTLGRTFSYHPTPNINST